MQEGKLHCIKVANLLREKGSISQNVILFFHEMHLWSVMVEYLLERTAMHFVIWIYKKVKLSQIGLSGTYTKEEVSVIVACVCVCLYSSTCWFLPAARHLRHTWEVRINDLLLWVFLGAAAKFLHVYLRIYLISNSSQPLTGEKRIWYNVWNPSKRWYILT